MYWTNFLAIISLASISLQLEFQRENTDNGLEFNLLDSINIKDKNLTLYFQFDVSIIREIINKRQGLAKKCPSNPKLIEPLELEFQLNTKWADNETSFELKNDTTNLIHEKFYYIELLKGFFENIDKLRDTCDVLKSIISYFSQVNLNLNHASKLNTTLIKDMIDQKIIITQVKRFLKDRQRKVDFALSSNHPEIFFNRTTMKFHYKNYKVTLGFEIPVYRLTNLYTVHKKPFLIREDPYILKTQPKFAIFNGEYPMFYSDRNFDKYCFHINDTYFCKIKPKIDDICIYDLFHGIFSENCLRKLPEQNTITKIYNSFHCIVFESLTLQTICNGTMSLWKLKNHTKIINTKHDCHLNNSFFEYDPKFQHKVYEIFTSNSPDYLEYELYRYSIPAQIEIYLAITIFTIVTMTLLVIVSIGFLKWNETYEVESEIVYSDIVEKNEYEYIDTLV